MAACSTLRLGIAQISSQPKLEHNLPILEECLKQISKQNADLLVFPEYCLSLGSLQRMAEYAKTSEQWENTLGEICRKYQCATVFGGVPLTENKKCLNSALVFSEAGELLARYDKRHLFSLGEGDKKIVQESDFFSPGNSPPTVFCLCGWQIAITICFDLRFPVFWQSADPHPDLYLCPSAFTHATGKDHWHTLLQARAIENLSWVAGIGQCGKNLDTGLELHGHSVVFDAWGKQATPLFQRKPACFLAELNKQILVDSRRRLPACAFNAAVKKQEITVACRQ